MPSPELQLIHEDRIQRLEDGVKDLAVSVSALETKQDTVISAQTDMMEKLDEWTRSMNSMATKWGPRIDILEADRNERKQRASARKQWVLGIVAGVILLLAGVFIKAKLG